MKPTLLVLAAGLGTRYGGMKQLEPVGPGGATIMDYSIYDALRSGFGKVVFVIRPDMEAAVRQTLGARYGKRIEVEYAFQRAEDLPAGFSVPPGRVKPWGTGHAALAAAGVIHEPFAAINADDFYGRSAFAGLAAFLQGPQGGDVPTYAMVGYALRDTLTEAGAVSRGVCRCTADGWLVSITETIGLERHGRDARYRDAAGAEQVIDGDATVSMNTWGFDPGIFDQLRERFGAFLEANARSEKAEFYLPTAVQQLLSAGRARVKVLPAQDKWCGVTHRQDKERAAAMIADLTQRGVYPERLW